jgi:hypothetical protein
VVFRAWPDGEVVAVFPTLPGTPRADDCLIYAHVGQHGSADCAGLTGMTRPARPEQYEGLLEELRTVGYRPKVYRRVQPWMCDQRLAMLRGV